MTSSMLAGERRWASARRGGMTVLGKVAVPKPINLPSQRLEKHGLDPNVDIVPKGSLSWGSRPSSSASNPWGSSAPSPTVDCPNGSPSQVGGRPSSGGSGTRPSTAGSDRMHEPVPTARGSNSRPSSASGVLTSNQTPLAPLRPQSAETRPGSSNLSRFAEHIPDNSGAWGPAGNVDKMIVASTKSDGFSLSSGDFPTLGSEKDISEKKPDSHEYGSRDRPRSSSYIAAADDGTIASDSDMKGGNARTWKRDDSQHTEEGVDHNSNNWQGGYPQQFLNTNVPPQHFDVWRGPPVNSPAGVWYRGPPGGPPYGPHVAPGGFPLEPFPYYRPHMPPHALGNSQPVPQQVPVGGPRGHHPKNGDLFRPQIPDGYMHPGMPVRPGFYPRPVPYDNYYGAPMGYNPNERDIPFMGMPAGPPVFNRYPAQNGPDHSNTHAKAGGRGPNATNSLSEQVESGNSNRGPYKVLMKQHNDLDAQGEEGSWENTAPGNVSFPETGGQPNATFRKNEWGTEGRRQEMHSRSPAFGDHSASRKFDNRGHPLHTAKVMSPERIDHVDRDWGKKSDTASAMSPFPDAGHVPKHSDLLQKIEGLNAKARASDSRRDMASASCREEQHVAISKTCKNDVGTASLCAERPNSRDSIHSSGEGLVSRGHLICQSNAGITNSRRANNGAESQFEHRGKGRGNTDADGWRKKPIVAESVTAIPTTNVVPISIGNNQDTIHAEVYATTEPSFPANNDGESSTQIHDTSDTQAQRAKMRELAKQRAIQLQKEEEQRIKEQKAKALAKLEELNRRSQCGDVLTEKSEKTPHSGMIVSQEEQQTLAEPVKYAPKSEAPSPIMTSSSDIVGSAIESCTLRVAERTVLSKDLHKDTSDVPEQVTTAPLSSPLKLDSAGTNAGDVKAVVRGNDSSCSTKHKHTGYKNTQDIQVEHPFAESLISFGTIGLTNIHGSVAVEGTAFSETVSEAIVPGPQSTIYENSNTERELSAAQRKKSIKTGKNKTKPETPLSVSDSQVQVSRHPNLSKSFVEIGKMEASQSKASPGSVQAMKEDLEQLAEQHSLISEGSQVKVNNYLKSQPPRRMPRNGQATKAADKYHGNDASAWAPVRSHHGAEAEDGADRKAVPDSIAVSTKSDNFVQYTGKSKRAEMERYVPKPVAKELAQQGTIQQLSSVAQNTLNETVGGRESSVQESSQATRSVVENVRRTPESNTGISKQGKQTKAYGGWKQRGLAESSRVQMGSSSNSSTNLKNMDYQESFIPDEHQVIAETNVSHVWEPSDGWNMPEEPTAAVNVSFGVKDQVAVKGKGKRQPYKGHKIIASKHDVDQKNSNSGEMYKKPIQSSALEISQHERTIAAKENRGSGERSSSLWQPKPQVYTANAQTGSRSSGGQHVSSEAGWGTKEDYSSVIGDASVTLNEDHTEVIPQIHTGHFPSKNRSVRQSTNVLHQGRREKKVASDKEHFQPHHKHGLGGMDELAPPQSGDTHYEQRSSSGFRKHGNQNNRSGRVQEPREDWSSLEQDGRHRNVPVNRERQQKNSHYEYQPVRSHNHSKSNNIEGPDASHNMSSRYRERGQGQLRRGGGNSYGRKSGAVQVDAE